MAEQLTHWKKNLDPRYISGEDLNDGIAINKGLRPEMTVTVSHFEDKPVFDQKENKQIIKTGFFLKEYPSGKVIYKPMVLNNKNAAFWISETGSPFMEKWLNIPAVLWAQPDVRHGFVARFKKYYPPAKATDTAAIASLNTATNLTELGEKWAALSAEEKKFPTVLALKESLKKKLTT